MSASRIASVALTTIALFSLTRLEAQWISQADEMWSLWMLLP